MYRIIVKSNRNEVYLCLLVKRKKKKYQDFMFHNGVRLTNETLHSSDLLHGLSFHIVV